MPKTTDTTYDIDQASWGDEENPDTNYGNNVLVNVIALYDKSDDEKMGWPFFYADMSGLASNRVVREAWLDLTVSAVTKDGGDDMTGAMYGGRMDSDNEDWVETECTWTIEKAGGVVSQATAQSAEWDELIDAGEAWDPNEWVNAWVKITAGTGAPASRFIESNTATILTVTANWAPVRPDATSEYEIFWGWENQDYPIPAVQDGPVAAGEYLFYVPCNVAFAHLERSGDFHFIFKMYFALTDRTVLIHSDDAVTDANRPDLVVRHEKHGRQVFM